MVHPGDPFWVTGYLINQTEPLLNIPVFFILKWYDTFWFWPSWTDQTGGVDYMIQDVPLGKRAIHVVPEFIWPDTGDDTLNSLWFYGAMLNHEMTEILGEYAAVNWGFGP